MVTGEARRRGGALPTRFMVKDKRPNRPPHRWCEIWEGNPRIARPDEAYDDVICSHGGNRPYIVSKAVRQWVWREYGPTPGEIYLTAAELSLRQYGHGRVIVQPGIKAAASPNKHWGWANWQDLVQMKPGMPWLQIGDAAEARLPGVEFLETRTFRDACGVLAGAATAVLHEGGLHHAAAALDVPAVVIFGGFIAPAVTGYAMHRNLFVHDKAHPLGCGYRVPCRHCQAAMASITPRHVLNELEVILATR